MIPFHVISDKISNLPQPARSFIIEFFEFIIEIKSFIIENEKFIIKLPEAAFVYYRFCVCMIGMLLLLAVADFYYQPN
jgi:hypothetical protein